MLLIKICVCLCLLTLVEIKTLNKIVVVNLRQVTLQLINSRFFYQYFVFQGEETWAYHAAAGRAIIREFGSK